MRNDPVDVIGEGLTAWLTEHNCLESGTNNVFGMTVVALDALANAGFHVVRDGQAVVEGTVYLVTRSSRSGPWTLHVEQTT